MVTVPKSKEEAIALTKKIARLRRKAIITKLREEGMTLEGVGTHLNISATRVRQILDNKRL